MSLAKWRNFIIDMDGVLWRGETALPGLCTFFKVLRESECRIVLATNNSNRTVPQYVAKLARMGVQVAEDEILTSAQATAIYLANIAPRGTRVSVIGGDGLLASLGEQGFEITDEDPAYVVVGSDFDLHWTNLNDAVLNIRDGAIFVGTNADATYPTEKGIGIGNGAILAALQAATSVTPIVIGKPEPPLYEQALQRLRTEPAETLVVGDRLDTDILGARRAGIAGLLLLTGVTTSNVLARSELQPDMVLPGLPELANAMRSETELTLATTARQR
ncbi:MAG: HAD-IIA family hydrolase [Anaerolineales bacterium]|nr:HAD-IIA family hydrolase [Anaerolineales bacterium]